MAEKGEMGDPATGNPQDAGGAEGDTGGLLDDFLTGAGDKGSSPAAKTPPSGGESADGKQAAPDPAAPLAQPKGPATVPAWKKQLKADLQGEERLDRFDGPDPLARGYLELEGKLGQAIFPPGKDATKEEWDGFYKKIGRPDSPKDYTLDGIEIPEGYAEQLDNFQKLKEFAHRVGMAKSQFRLMVKESLRNLQAQSDQDAAAYEQRRLATEGALRKAWGGKYAETIELANRAIRDLGSPSLIKDIKASGLLANVDFMRLIGKVGQDRGEDSLIGDRHVGPDTDDLDFPGL